MYLCQVNPKEVNEWLEWSAGALELLHCMAGELRTLVLGGAEAGGSGANDDEKIDEESDGEHEPKVGTKRPTDQAARPATLKRRMK